MSSNKRMDNVEFEQTAARMIAEHPVTRNSMPIWPLFEKEVSRMSRDQLSRLAKYQTEHRSRMSYDMSNLERSSRLNSEAYNATIQTLRENVDRAAAKERELGEKLNELLSEVKAAKERFRALTREIAQEHSRGMMIARVFGDLLKRPKPDDRDKVLVELAANVGITLDGGDGQRNDGIDDVAAIVYTILGM